MSLTRTRRTSVRPAPALAAVLGAVLGGVVLAGCGDSATDSGGGSGGVGYISDKGVITRLGEESRERPAAPLTGTTLDGETVSLSDYEGSVVVVNVWGSWCAPCRAEAPDLVEAAEELSGSGVRFLGINTRDHDPANARAFVRRYQVRYPSIYDQGGEALLAFSGTLTPNSVPSTVILDEQGRVAASVLGEVSRSTLVGLVEDVAASGGSGDGSA